MKAVLDARSVSSYDDEITRRYHFPSRYLSILAKCVGDWAVFREPRHGGGTKAYFAVARIDSITDDVDSPGLFYAHMSGFLPFDSLVPWRSSGRYAEAAIRDLEAITKVGVYMRGRSVRALSDEDFIEILGQGFKTTLDPDNEIRLGLDQAFYDESLTGIAEGAHERRVMQVLINRRIRDAAFRGNICQAYADTCAVTGLKIINGGGRSEVQAAHIWSVASGGPDTIQNGIALSGTIHWLFDRHLISLSADYELLVSERSVPAEILGLMKANQRINLPVESSYWPSLDYIARHRAIYAGRNRI